MRKEYPKMLYAEFPEYALVSSAEEEAKYVAKGYSPLSWSSREAGLSANPPLESKEACPYCGRNFTTKMGLAAHIGKAHRGATPKVEQG
jgi:hypothetical protein